MATKKLSPTSAAKARVVFCDGDRLDHHVQYKHPGDCWRWATSPNQMLTRKAATTLAGEIRRGEW